MQGDHDSFLPVLSADGRFLAFTSLATDLVSGDTNGTQDVFLRDRLTGAVERVSVSSNGTQGNDISQLPAVSADGRYVAFQSLASFAPADTNGLLDVYVRDRQNGTTTLVSPADMPSGSPAISADGRYVAYTHYGSTSYLGAQIFLKDLQTGIIEEVSVNSSGIPGSPTSRGSDYAAVSQDGRFVAFWSDDADLVAGDTNGAGDIFLRDRQSGTTERVSLDNAGSQVSGNSAEFFPSISADGRYVAFASDAATLVPGDTNGRIDVFLRDRQAATTERVSIATDGTQGNQDSITGMTYLSSDGRYVAFYSLSSTLVPGDTNAAQDVFVRDRQTGTTQRASVATGGAQANGNSGGQSVVVSGDGHFVAFESDATNLVPGDTNGAGDVFVRDMQAETTERDSVFNRTGNSSSDQVSMSPDGRFVALQSSASDLVPNDTNGAPDVFVYDSQSGTTDRVSVTSSGAQANGGSYHPTISPDGRYVAFDSYATNLVSGSTSGRSDVYLRDRQAGTTEVVSLSSGGARGNSDSFRPSISADGRYVAFESNATNLVSGDTNGVYDVFVRDRQTGTTVRASVSSSGAQGDGISYVSSISADGRYVAFQSMADNLVTGDTNFQMDIFVRDLQAGATERVSISSGGAQGGGQCSGASISADGRNVAFASNSSNLVSGDTNGTYDVFVRDRQAGTTERESVDSSGVGGNGQSLYSVISATGRFVAFYSEATNLVSGDVNGFGDIFLRDRQAHTTTRVSVDTGGAQGNANSGNGTADPAVSPVSADGRWIAFVSLASNLVPGDANSAADVFVRDRGTDSAFATFCFGDGTVAPCPCGNSGMPGHGCENSSTTGGSLLSASGVASLASDSVHFTAIDEKPTASSVLLQGTLAISPITYGDGLRCAGGTLKRLFTHNAAGGMVTFPQGADPSVSAQSAAKGDVILGGSTRDYQVYYRDPSASFCPPPNGSTYNISNAIAVAWGS